MQSRFLTNPRLKGSSVSRGDVPKMVSKAKKAATLVCEINMPVRINVLPGKFPKDDKHAPWKT